MNRHRPSAETLRKGTFRLYSKKNIRNITKINEIWYNRYSPNFTGPLRGVLLI